jgi:hypothetical protein
LPAQAGTAFRDVPVQLHHWLARVGEVDVPAFDFSARQELPGVMATAMSACAGVAEVGLVEVSRRPEPLSTCAGTTALSPLSGRLCALVAMLILSRH